MSESNESLNRTNELLEQLLEQERQKTAAQNERMQQVREAANLEVPKLEGLISGEIKAGVSDPKLEARMQEIREKADERHQEEMAYRERLIAILDEQTAILTEIAAQLKR